MGENKTDMRFMTRDAIKYLAIVAMTLDHVAYIFLETQSLLYRLFLCIGTFTGPVMIYFLIEGYFYTHDVRGYAKRLLCGDTLFWRHSARNRRTGAGVYQGRTDCA